jgi:hypothetical protein
MATQGSDLIQLSNVITELMVKGKDGEAVRTQGTAQLDGKTIALYFSAHWCAFTFAHDAACRVSNGNVI